MDPKKLTFELKNGSEQRQNIQNQELWFFFEDKKSHLKVSQKNANAKWSERNNNLKISSSPTTLSVDSTTNSHIVDIFLFLLSVKYQKSSKIGFSKKSKFFLVFFLLDPTQTKKIVFTFAVVTENSAARILFQMNFLHFSNKKKLQKIFKKEKFGIFRFWNKNKKISNLFFFKQFDAFSLVEVEEVAHYHHYHHQ